jgi:RND family efflux transporter MFP subunit
MGTVIPAQKVSLESQVAGQVVATHPDFTPGGFINKHDLVIQLDPKDYQLALSRTQSDLVNAQYYLKLERGRQDVALREWQLLNAGRNPSDTDSELALRKPHLDKAEADVAAAEAAVTQASLDLERTRISAPFNALVLSKAVDVGSQVAPQEPLAELVGTDTYWVQASIPIERLDWIQVPRQIGDAGAPVKIEYGLGHTIGGTVARLVGDLDSEGRMARIIIAVDDPLNRASTPTDSPPLLLGEYVRVAIQGRLLDNVFAVPREALHDDNTVWLADQDDKLAIRKVYPLWRDPETVLLHDDLKPGDRLIVTDLPAPVNGMELRIEADRPSRPSEDNPAAEPPDSGRPIG